MTARPKPNNTFNSSNTRHNIARMLEALAHPKTYAELETILHMSKRSVHFYIEHLRQKPNRRVYKKTHLLIGGRYHAVFALGARRDAAVPKQTEVQKNAKWRQKVKSDPDLAERQRQYEKARWLLSRPKVANSWFGALSGSRAIQRGAQP